jgi:hypothetical protein
LLQNNPSHRINWEDFFHALNLSPNEESLPRQKIISEVFVPDQQLIEGMKELGINQERANFVICTSRAKTLEEAISWFVKFLKFPKL